MKLGVFCVIAVGVCGLTAMLVQGCKKEQETPPPVEPTSVVDTSTPPAMVTTGAPPAAMSTGLPPVAVTPPVAPVEPVVPAAPAASEYTIVKGDTLAKIAKNNHVSLKALMDANPGVQPTKLKVGQKITLPAGSTAAPAAMTAPGTEAASGAGTGGETYIVKSGDTLAKIAKNQGVTLKALRAVNPKFASTDRIHVGDKLTIPAKAETASAPAPAPAAAPVASMTTPVTTPAPTGTPSGQ